MNQPVSVFTEASHPRQRT